MPNSRPMRTNLSQLTVDLAARTFLTETADCARHADMPMHGTRPEVIAGSALAVLRRLTGLLQAVLLALDGTRVTGEEAGLLQRGPVLGLTMISARAMASRSAPAWPDGPPPCRWAKMSKLSTRSTVTSGALMSCWCTLLGK